MTLTYPLQNEEQGPQGGHLLLPREVNQGVQVVQAILLCLSVGHALDREEIQVLDGLEG